MENNPEVSINWHPSLSFCLALVALILGSIGACELMNRQISVFVPKRDLPAKYQIKENDLIEQKYPDNNSTPAPLLKSQIIGCYTLVKLSKQEPLVTDKKQLLTDSLKNTVEIAITATPSMTFGGDLKAGDRVDILAVKTIDKNQDSTQSTSSVEAKQPEPFKDILVLDVKPTKQSSVVVIALLSENHTKFATAATGATLWLTRRVPPSNSSTQCPTHTDKIKGHLEESKKLIPYG
jgi:Flp pilus assembly protein CpaB